MNLFVRHNISRPGLVSMQTRGRGTYESRLVNGAQNKSFPADRAGSFARGHSLTERTKQTMYHLQEMHGRLKKSIDEKWDYFGTAKIRGKLFSVRGRNEKHADGKPFVMLSIKPFRTGPKIVADEKGGAS